MKGGSRRGEALPGARVRDPAVKRGTVTGTGGKSVARDASRILRLEQRGPAKTGHKKQVHFQSEKLAVTKVSNNGRFTIT